MYKSWSRMKTSEYKAYKGIRKESLRDNMTDIEVLLTDLGGLRLVILQSLNIHEDLKKI